MVYMTPKGLVDIYPEHMLSDGFKYPQKFLDMVGKTDTRWYHPWYFFSPLSESGKLSQKVLVEGEPFIPSLKGKLPLVPFALLDLGDGDTACFDGSDTSGNPAVIMAIFDKSDRKYGFRDFDHWLEEAEKESKKWDRRWLEDPDFKGYDKL